MSTEAQRPTLRNIPLKAVSLVIGCAIWYIVSSSFGVTVQINVPISFYNTPNSLHIDAPETVSVELLGKRSFFRRVGTKNIALHIDASSFVEGKNRITISRDTLLLPDGVSIASWSPMDLFADVKKQD